MNLSLFGYIKEKPPWKEILVLLILLLIPNILRQIVYFFTFLFTNSTEFIVSFETKTFFSTNILFLGFVEEIIIAIIFTFFWFKFTKLRFFAYGWISDAAFDFLSVLVWFLVGSTPLQLLGFNTTLRFFIREIVISYIIAGPILYKLNVNIKKLSFYYALFGLLVLSIILFFSL